MRILGIDPGYGIVGYGVIDFEKSKYAVVDYGTICTPKDESVPQRLALIYNTMEEIIKHFKPDCIAVEEVFYFKNQTTIIPVAEARGVILLACTNFCGSLFEYTPLQVKQALTGHGRAEKQQVQFMVKNILKLEKIPKPDDAADALAIAICHSQINPRVNVNRI